mgnify:CR=1 FL=1|tara:strand:+ start:1026 stop:1196 length:171 start_codon:yes stop_codon:yes gene_type:complete
MNGGCNMMGKKCKTCGKVNCGCKYDKDTSVYLSPNAKKKGNKWWTDHPSQGTKMGY